MTIQNKKAAGALMALTVGLAGAEAQTTPTAAGAPAAPTLSPTEKWIQDAKKPTDWLTWGADIRLRNEYGNNLVSLDEGLALHEQDYFRFRGRVYASIAPIKDLSLNTRFSAEPRNWMNPSFVGAYRSRTGMEWRYGIFDNLNVQWKNIADQPLTLTVGRQDLQLGDTLNWWLVADGTPADGSWTFFLDSARLSLDLKDCKTKLDAMYIYQSASPDEWLPTLGSSQGYTLTEQREQGAILYASNKSIEKTQIDAYFMYKHDNAEYRFGDNADLYTMGAKVSGDITDHLGYSAEAAYQFGNKQVTTDAALTEGVDRDVSAWGVNARLLYQVKDEMKNRFRLSCEYLSGDDPGSAQNESFDLLWGRWPRWSELYIYSYIPEYGRVAQVGNIVRFGPGWSITPAKNLDVSFEYNAVFSDQPFSNPDGVALPGSGGFGDGTFRGHYLQAVLKYKFCQNVSGHLWGEFMWMGDYYAQRDTMAFLRAELLFTF